MMRMLKRDVNIKRGPHLKLKKTFVKYIIAFHNRCNLRLYAEDYVSDWMWQN